MRWPPFRLQNMGGALIALSTLPFPRGQRFTEQPLLLNTTVRRTSTKTLAFTKTRKKAYETRT